jgi:hypothetical protein
MKTLLAFASVLVLSATAQAANSLEFDFRGDFQSVDYNEAAATTAPVISDYGRFYIKTGRLQYKGTLNERLSYVLRLGFYKPAVDTGTSNAKRDNLNSSVEYAYITDKMSDNFSLSMGKVNSEIGGFEGATSGADIYLTSPNYQHTAVKDLTGANLGYSRSGSANFLYITGLKATMAFAETQNIYLLATNNIGADPVDAGGNINQDRGMMGIVWRGTFAEKTLFGLLSYHEAATQSATGDSGNKHTFASAGVKYDVADWVGSLEYNMTDYKDGVGGKKDSLYSAILKLGYKMDQWTPRLEFFTSEEKIEIATTTTNKFTGVGAVLEYKPSADNFRYHLAYNTITAKPETGADQMRTEIVVGARLLGDFLK